ncbi:MAG: iron-containing alcohol dehydrogenase, partial [Clostridia bacterium]|nr:iron-containing alcohol dehydrogenase [Clostridia bacterium]
MNNFTFYSPTYFAFGKGAEHDAGKYVRRFGGTKALIHYGGGSVVRSGLLDRVKASLEKEGVAYVELGGVKPNPRSGLVYEGIELCRREGVDFVLAVGGGSSIDSAKAIAAGTVYDGDFWDFYQGKPVDKALPIGTVLTIAAAGSEGSPDSVITYEDGMYKRGASGEGLRPAFSILNPELTQTHPPNQTASGITDNMAHHYERYHTNTKDVEVTDPG